MQMGNNNGRRFSLQGQLCNIASSDYLCEGIPHLGDARSGHNLTFLSSNSAEGYWVEPVQPYCTKHAALAQPVLQL